MPYPTRKNGWAGESRGSTLVPLQLTKFVVYSWFRLKIDEAVNLTLKGILLGKDLGEAKAALFVVSSWPLHSLGCHNIIPDALNVHKILFESRRKNSGINQINKISILLKLSKLLYLFIF